MAATEPREKMGTYWGYTTRLASGLGAVLNECPYEVRFDSSLVATIRLPRRTHIRNSSRRVPLRHLFNGLS